MDIQEGEIKQLIEVAGDPFVLEIGAMDGVSYDTLYSFIMAYKMRGLLVEPLSDLFDSLVANYANNPRLLFENAAITEEAGEREIYRIDKAVFDTDGSPIYSDGMSSFFLDRNAIGTDPYRSHVKTERVRCMTLPQLLDRHRVKRIDLLQIDTEGYDYEILAQLDFNRYQPYIVKIETWSELVEVREAVLQLLDREGYHCRFWGDDIIGTKGLGAARTDS